MSGGEMSSLMRTFAWATTPLGPCTSWPQSLKSAVDLILDSEFPMIILWAPKLTQIYNDTYRSLMGIKHPAGLGQPTRDCWPEVWHINEPIYARVLKGETLTLEDQLFPITRRGYLEQAWFTLCYSPLRDERSLVTGVLVTVFETTQRFTAERERQEALDVLRAKEALQTYIVELSDILRAVAHPQEIASTACRLLGQRLGASRAYYNYRNEGGKTVVAEGNYVRQGESNLAGADCSEDYLRVRNILEAHGPLVLNDLARSPDLPVAERQRFLKLHIAAYVGASIARAGELVAVFNVCDSVPREWTQLEISMIQETADRTWALIERAQAEAAVQEANARAQTERAMRAADERFRALVTASSDVLYRMDPTWTEMRYLGSQGFLKATENPSGNWLEEYIPASDRPAVLAAIRRATETKTVFELEHRVFRQDGSLGWTLSRAVPLLDAEGRITEWFGAANDVTSRRQAEGFRQSLAEREALLKEVHHRVKNNLQVITSLLEMQANRAEDIQTFKALQEARNRIASLDTMHQLLYQTGSSAAIPLAPYARQLADFIVGYHGLNNRVRLEVEDDGMLELERAVPLGLLLNELVSNACKHAFPGTRLGSIQIRLSQEDDMITVRVVDDGVGLAKHVRTQPPMSLGMTLIHALAEQLRATVSYESNTPGTTVRVDIPSLSAPPAR